MSFEELQMPGDEYEPGAVEPDDYDLEVWASPQATSPALVNGQVSSRLAPLANAIDALDFLKEPEPEYDWAIPGVLERTDRLITTGHEGIGKSTLLRQIAVQCAAGIHPFTLKDMPYLRVLVLDLENSRRHVRRQLRPLILSTKGELGREQLFIQVRSEGIDLLHKEDRQWLTDLVAMVNPDLFVTGPIYKCAGGDPREEPQARVVSQVFDELRITHACALILESHQPYATSGSSKRPDRPYGASLWSRWPEFGIHLDVKGAIRHWRGARDERSWPLALRRGGEWPWTVETDPKAVTFARILDLMRHEGRALNERDISDMLGIAKSTVHRAIEVNRAQFEAVRNELEPF